MNEKHEHKWEEKSRIHTMGDSFSVVSEYCPVCRQWRKRNVPVRYAGYDSNGGASRFVAPAWYGSLFKK